jgi:hypothetical protein
LIGTLHGWHNATHQSDSCFECSYLFAKDRDSFVLGNWSRVNFAFVYQATPHQTVLAAPFRFKTMDEFLVLGNNAAMSMTFVRPNLAGTESI